MKKALSAVIAVILLVTVASADLTLFAKFKDLFTPEAIEAADKAELPEGIYSESLTQFERELFELGFAAGYDAGYEQAVSPKVTYILNTSSMKFHKPDCSGVKNMSEKNKQEVTCTRDELLDQGYTPCGTCNP